jgi:hypothetical protein
MFKSKGAKKKLDRKLYDGVKADNVREKPKLWPRVPTVSHTPTHTRTTDISKKNAADTHVMITTRTYTRSTEHEHTPNRNLLASHNSSSVPVANVAKSLCCSLRWVCIKVACPWLQSSMCMH